MAFFQIFLFSCSKNLGYSAVLWGDEKNGLSDGEIVTVLVRSNITHSYIITLPDQSGSAEIPLWQLSEPESKARAQQTAARLLEYAHTFASVKLDGLPIRAEAVNTSKQVYRLREKEIIRILYKGEGVAVTNAQGAMEGEWFRVLTRDGTQGWCFSHNLELYRSEEGGKREEEAIQTDERDEALLKNLQETRWYPLEFMDFIKAKRIDLKRMDEKFGFFLDTKNSVVSILTADENLSWKFGETKAKSGGKILFEGAAVTAQQKGSELTITYMENGKPKNARFCALKEDISLLIQNEKNRRQKEWERITNKSRVFSSSNYGTLSLSLSGTFGWKNFSPLVPEIVSQNARGSGTVGIEYFLSDSLKSSYDGILTFHFTGMEKEVNFLYKITDTGLRLEDAHGSVIKNNVVISRAQSPLVIFFTAKT